MTAAPAAPPRPPLPARAPRVAEVVAAAGTVLERAGIDGLTMQSVADELGIKAPSLYKHLAGKRAIEVELIVDTLAEVGEVLHEAIAGPASPPVGTAPRVAALLAAYRSVALAQPHRYRLATSGHLPRADLPPRLEDWAGEPFLLVTGDAHRAQALWAFTHGMVVLEIDGRFPDASQLDPTWAEGARAFAPAGG